MEETPNNSTGLPYTTFVIVEFLETKYNSTLFQEKTWNTAWVIIMWTAVEEAPNNSTGLPYTT